MKNFKIEEFTESYKAKKLGIDNTPSPEIKKNIISLVDNILQPVRDEYGKPIIVSSGYRCEKLNKAVGGATNSDHKYGCAADIQSKEDTKEENKKLFDLICKMAKEGKIKCRQIIDESNFSWIHVSINNKYNSQKNNQILHL